MNKKKARYIIIPFLSIVFGFLILNIITPEKKYSIVENRNLEKKPVLKDIKEGEFTSKFESYYNDQFVLRDEMISINKKSEVKLNKTKVGNYYLVDNNWILGMFSKLLSEKQLNDYSNAINKLSEISLSLDRDVYFTMMPHKTNILKHLYPKYVDTIENIDINKNEFRRRLESDIVTYIDMDEYMLNNFSQDELERLYFKTDHHWTGIGAFENFKMMASRIDLGVSQDELNNHFNRYKITTVKSKNFIGSYNRNLDMIVKEEEYANYAYIDNTKYTYEINGKKKKEEDIIATSRNDKEWDYGGAYIRGAQTNILNIKNEDALVDKKILIFRDSYQAPTTWLFADLFREVEIADPRNIDKIDKTYKEIIEESNSDIVMFMYNSSGFGSMIKTMIDKGIK
ncbi:alginate O-acetyltransferase AlgX-related protein [Faecalimicrobium sp. JNUCC 81]